MSDSQAAMPSRRTPMGVEPPVREPARASARTPARAFTQPEPDKKYALYPEEIPEGMDAQWVPTKIAGMPTPQVGNAYRSGWMPAKAADVPRVSGYGVEYPPEMVEAGYITPPKPDTLIEIDDQILMFRPKELSQRARAASERAAVDQVTNQFERLRQAYRADGNGLGIKRRPGPMPDLGGHADE